MKFLAKQIMAMTIVFSVIALTPSFASFSDVKNIFSPRVMPIAKLRVIATAYYKPHRNQNKYAYGSYKEEVRVNGKGKVFSGGRPVRIGDIAADWKVLPAGTVVWIPNFDLIATVTDIGKDIKGRRIDVFVGEGESALEKAMDFGKRSIDIFVIKWGR